MLIKKIFKKFRKFKENLLNDSKLTHYAFSSYKKKRWEDFKKPLKYTQNNDDNIKISNFYKKDLLIKQKKKLLQITLKSHLNLVTALVEVKFCKTFQESFFFIANGSIKVNNNITTNPLIYLYPGDIVSLHLTIQKKNWFNSFFFTTYKTTTTAYKFNMKYEVSFSGTFFVICF